MRNILWAAAYGYIVHLVTGFNPADWQWWALFGGAVIGVLINVID